MKKTVEVVKEKVFKYGELTAFWERRSKAVMSKWGWFFERCCQSIGSLFSSGHFPAACRPDSAPQLYAKPASDYVLCRDEHGKTTALYGDAVWDFNPYRLSAKKIRKINFGTVLMKMDKSSWG